MGINPASAPRVAACWAALLVTVALLAGCGTDPSATHADTSEPTRTNGAWPAYGGSDYRYTLRTSCFCVDAGIPVTVTVRDGRVVSAVYAVTRYGRRTGAPAEEWMRLTINDIIDAANNKHADRVLVKWPDGQRYPTSVWVDRDAGGADDEIGYAIRHVLVPA